MRKKKSLFIIFEGIEGSGKSYQSHKLYRALKKKKFSVIITREPGGTKNAEKIRSVILNDYFSKDSNNTFDKYTDTLLYLAARNEHVKNVIKPSILKKKIIICDRFIDSTLAYQVYGKKIDKNLVLNIHKHILKGIKPDLTFILKVSIKKALQRLKKRKNKNRYDKFSKNFYIKVQNAFLDIAKKNKNKYFIIENSKDSNQTEKIIYNKIINKLKND